MPVGGGRSPVAGRGAPNGTTCTLWPVASGQSPVASRGAPNGTPCTPWGASRGSPGRTRNGTTCTLWPVAGGLSPVAGRSAPNGTHCTPRSASCGSPGRTRNGTPCTPYGGRARRAEWHNLHTVGCIPRKFGPHPKWHTLHTVWGAGTARRVAQLAHRGAHPAEVRVAPGMAQLAHRMGGGHGVANGTACTLWAVSRGSPPHRA